MSSKRWIVGGCEVGVEVPVVALAARMTRWAIRGRYYHPLVSFSDSRWAATKGRSASAVCTWVVTLVRMPVIPVWSCEAGLGGVRRLTSIQQQNQTRARVRNKGEWNCDDS